MTWRSEKPIVPGWYWLKDGSAEVIVQVEIGLHDSFHIEWVWFAGSRMQVPLASMQGHCHWAGPIPVPEEG